MVFTSFIRAAVIALLVLVAGPVWAQGGSVGIVEKKIFTMPSYTTVGGATLSDVKVGWEAYGTLNAARDNAIIVPHFYTGNSARRRQVQGGGCRARLLGCDHRPRQADRHRQILCRLRRHAGEPQHQGSQHHDHRPGDDQPRDGQALGHELPHRHLPRLRQCPEGAARLSRRAQAACGDRCLDGLAAEPRMGRRLSRFRRARRAGDRHCRDRCVLDRAHQHVDVRHHHRSQLERRRLLRQDRADRRPRLRAQDGDARHAPSRLGREDLRAQMGRRRSRPGQELGQQIPDRGHAR